MFRRYAGLQLREPNGCRIAKLLFKTDEDESAKRASFKDLFKAQQRPLDG